MKKEASFSVIMTILFVLVLTGVLAGCGGGGGGSAPSGSGDTTAPTTPTNLNATAPSISQINLSWNAATDTIGVAGYKIYRDGAYLKSVTGTVTTNDTGLSTNTTYCYKVSAYDAANNESSQSTQACATTLYTKQMGTSSYDAGAAVAVDASGNVYVVGSTQGSLDGNSSAGDKDVFLVKYSVAGIKQWSRQLGTSSIDNGYGIAVDTSGNVYITGATFGSLDGNINVGYADMFLVKYDATGTKQWTRQLGTSSNDGGNDIAVDTSGDIYIAGNTYGGLDGNINAGDNDMFLVKYNSAGAKQWTQQLGSSLDDVASGIAIDPSGNIYVTGNTTGGLDGNINAGMHDMFLVKYNSAGTKQWTRQLGTSTLDVGNGVAVDLSGNIYVTGETYGGLDGNINAGGNDMFLVKYNSAGTKQWTQQLGSSLGNVSDVGIGVAVDTSGNIYVTGATNGSLDGNINAGGNDMFLVKYDATGTKQWTRQLGTALDDVGGRVAIDLSGNIYFTGYTKGSLDGNINAGDSDMFLVKYNTNGVKQ